MKKLNWKYTMTALLIFFGVVLAVANSEPQIVSPTTELLASQSELCNAISLTFSPSDRQLFSGLAYLSPDTPYPKGTSPYAQGGGVVRWNLSTRQQEAITYLPLWPTAMVPSPDGNHLFIGCGRCSFKTLSPGDRSDTPSYKSRGNIKVLDADTLEEQTSIETDNGIFGMALSPEGSLLATIGARDDNKIVVQLWKIEDWTPIEKWEFDGQPPSVLGPGALHPIDFSSDGKYLLAATVGSGERDVTEFRGKTTYTIGKSKVLYRTKLPGKIAIIDLEQMRIHGEFSDKNGPIPYFQLSDNDQQLAYVAGPSSFIAKVSLEKKQFQKPRRTSGGRGGVHVMPSGNRVICVIRKDVGKYEENVRKAYMCTTPDSGHLGLNRPPIIRFVRDQNSKGKMFGYNRSFTISNDNRRIAIGDQNGLINLWEIPEE